MHPVGTWLYVGRIPFPSERARLGAVGVTSVLNLCVEFPRPSRLREALARISHQRNGIGLPCVS